MISPMKGALMRPLVKVWKDDRIPQQRQKPRGLIPA